jgi:hypothetical protein
MQRRRPQQVCLELALVVGQQAQQRAGGVVQAVAPRTHLLQPAHFT